MRLNIHIMLLESTVQNVKKVLQYRKDNPVAIKRDL